MQTAELKNKKVAVWGLGREGKAAAQFIHARLPELPLTFIDEAPGPDKIDGLPDGTLILRGAEVIANALSDMDIIVKSPGVSLYNPAIAGFQKNGGTVTSLLNLWMAEPHRAKTVCVTGTKGKSTTSSLLAHTLEGLGHKVGLGGNIGVPVAEIASDVDYAVIEVSSYQAADFDGRCDIGILTLLQPEHLDWHGSKERYFADKLNLLKHAGTGIVGRENIETVVRHGIPADRLRIFNRDDGMHVVNGVIFDHSVRVGTPDNAYLARPHNMSNVCAVLTAIKLLGLDPAAALQTMHSYRGLPHRQQELGEKNGVLYVNDSIATAPQAAIAALEVYTARPVTLIAGGYDRGIDYAPLVDYILRHDTHAVVCLGPSGKRIHDALRDKRERNVFLDALLDDAVKRAKDITPAGGVILLSPAAPSYGMFKDFTERGRAFAASAGFTLEI